MGTSGCGVGPVPAPGVAPAEGGRQDQALAVLRCAMDFKFRNCSDLYFEKNPWGIKYLQKISSCVNNRKIQYFASGPVFNKFENFMILLLLFIAYFICQCLFSQAAWIRVFDHLVPTEHPKFPCREPVALAPAPPPPAENCPARRTDGPCRGDVSSAVPCPASGPCPSTAPRWSQRGATGVPVEPRALPEPHEGGGLRRVTAT